MSHQILLTEFYPDRPLLPWQQSLRQNGLYFGLYIKYHQDPKSKINRDTASVFLSLPDSRTIIGRD